jgi:hypothetical protein
MKLKDSWDACCLKHFPPMKRTTEEQVALIEIREENTNNTVQVPFKGRKKKIVR